MKTDTFYPFFCGTVIAALICFLSFPPEILAPVKPVVPEPVKLPVPAEPVLPDLLPIPAIWDIVGEPDDAPDFSQHSGSRNDALAFFTGLLRSRELATALLDNAEAFDISPSLAAALCWMESQFKVQAINRSNLNGTIDRGLFQLNSSTFPNLTEEEFFNPQTNAYYGMSHLRWCLDSGGSVVAGLAMYNAGSNRVHKDGTPKKTLDYIAGILDVQEQIERLFAGYCKDLERRQAAVAMAAVIDEEEEAPPEPELPRQPRLSLLRPISGRY